MTKAKKLGIVGLVVALGACASSIKSDVTRFHQLGAPQGETLAIVSPDPQKQGSLEFQRHAEVLMMHLSRQGFRPASDSPPTFIAHLDYFQQPVGDTGDDSRGRVSIGVGGGSGGYHRGGHVGVGVGTSFPIGESRSSTASRTLTLEIDRVASGERVFEGRVKSMGPARNFDGALPYMMDALFEDFPGTSGTTVTVEREVDPNRP